MLAHPISQAEFMPSISFPMRLDKYLGHATELSRELAKRAIRGKRVSVNGQIVKSASLSIAEHDLVLLDGEKTGIRGPRYYMLNKPADYVCATTDADSSTVLDLLGDDGAGLSIAGRLDKDTTGLVLLSDDGQWIHAIISPRRQCSKVYQAQLDGEINDEIIRQFSDGILLRNEAHPTRPAQLRAIGERQAEVIVHEGRYHQIKRMFAACGLHVVALHRTQIADLVLDPQLAPGEFRELSAAEAESIVT